MRLETIEVFRVTRDARFHFVIERHEESRECIRGRSSLVPRIDAHPTACAAGVNDDGVFEFGSLRRHSRDEDETASDEGVDQERHSRRIDAACSVSVHCHAHWRVIRCHEYNIWLDTEMWKCGTPQMTSFSSRPSTLFAPNTSLVRSYRGIALNSYMYS